jgi:3-hydroxymyristoyl/3-hydroxydecanoyl-(acyl carrier protein) dehydratase
MLLEAREKIGKAPKSVEDFQVKANFPATAVEFLGHFTAPAPVILPGHEILGYAHCLLMVHLNLPINITRISAKFKRAVVPGDNLRFVFNSFKLVGPIICCHVEISDESNNIVCEIRALEGRMLSYDKHCAFHWLIETACQAATLTQFYAEGRLEEPIALTAVEMSFTRLPLPGETVYAAVHKMTHKRGIDSCEADLTDQYGRHLARASSLNGINVSKLGIC